MAKQEKKLNIFDLLVFVIVILAVCVIGSNWFHKNVTQPTGKVAVTVKVPTENIENQAETQKSVYFNSVNKPVDVTLVKRDGDNLLITLSGNGDIQSGAYFFNGQRILVGQKVEIHSTYFAQGKVISVTNESN